MPRPRSIERILDEKKYYPMTGKGFVVERMTMPSMARGSQHKTLARFETMEMAEKFLRSSLSERKKMMNPTKGILKGL